MKRLSEHTSQESRKQLEEWRHHQAEQEQLFLTLWQQKHALQWQVEHLRQQRQVLLWQRQERARLQEERQGLL